MNDTIVVILDIRRPLADRSWMCHNKGEAQRLARWLSECFVPAASYTTEA